MTSSSGLAPAQLIIRVIPRGDPGPGQQGVFVGGRPLPGPPCPLPLLPQVLPRAGSCLARTGVSSVCLGGMMDRTDDDHHTVLSLVLSLHCVLRSHTLAMEPA